MSHEEGRREREARSVALERAYVHDVYDQISTQIPASQSRPWPCVNSFLDELEPGSLVADIGCGTGQYLTSDRRTCTLGVERCSSMAYSAKQEQTQVMIADNTCLPFRDESFDACISMAVIHHLATTERRVCALRELARILRIGGRLMISVWAMEQRSRKQFDSQDVLIPWHRPFFLSGDISSPSRDPTSTDDDDTYHWSQKTDGTRRLSRSDTIDEPCILSKHDIIPETGMKKFQDDLLLNIENHPPQGQDMTSPKQSCYSFVRRALQKLTSGRKSGCQGYVLQAQSYANLKNSDWSTIVDHQLDAEYPFECHDSIEDCIDDLPIELRHLEADDPILLDILSSDNYSFSYDSNSEERNPTTTTFASGYLPTENQLSTTSDSPSKVRTLLDSSTEDSVSNVIRSKSSSSCLSLSSRTNVSSPVSTSGVSAHSSDSNKGHESRSTDSGLDEESVRIARKRPTLRKQKASITELESSIDLDAQISKPNTDQEVSSVAATKPSTSITKQASLHDEMIYIDRFLENEKLKQSLPKQYSLNEDLIYGKKETEDPPISFKIFKKRFVHVKTIRERFQQLKAASLERFDLQSPVLFKGGVSKLLGSWKSESSSEKDVSKFAHLDPNKILNSANNIWNELNNACSNLSQKYKSNAFSECRAKTFDSRVDPHRYFDAENREIRLSKEESSDSSKDSSFQSDTSLDSEDSCISVIFVPNPKKNDASPYDQERHRSVSSESSEGSDKQNSPKSPKSPGNCPSPRYFSSNKFLSSKVNRLSTMKHNPKLTGCTSLDSDGRVSSGNVDEKSIPNVPVPSFSTGSSEIASPVNKTPQRNLPRSPFTESGALQTVLEDSDRDCSRPKLMVKEINSPPSRILVDQSTLPDSVSSSNQISLKTDSNRSKHIEALEDTTISVPPAEAETSIKCFISKASTSDKSRVISCDSQESDSKGTTKDHFRFSSTEVFNPEIDDVDSDCSSSSSSSSSCKSGNSVIELGWPTQKEIAELDKEIKRKEIESQNIYSYSDIEFILGTEEFPKPSLVEPVHRMDTINEENQSGEFGTSTSANVSSSNPLSSCSAYPLHSQSLESLVSRNNITPIPELRNLALYNKSKRHIAGSTELSRRHSEASRAETFLSKSENVLRKSSDSAKDKELRATGAGSSPKHPSYSSVGHNRSLEGLLRRVDLVGSKKSPLTTKSLSKSTGNIRVPNALHAATIDRLASRSPSISRSLSRSDDTLSEDISQLSDAGGSWAVQNLVKSSSSANSGGSGDQRTLTMDSSSSDNSSILSSVHSSTNTLSSSGSSSSLPNERTALRKLSPNYDRCSYTIPVPLKETRKMRDRSSESNVLSKKGCDVKCTHCQKLSYRNKSGSERFSFDQETRESFKSGSSCKVLEPLDSISSSKLKDSQGSEDEKSSRRGSLRSKDFGDASPLKTNTKSQESLQSDVGGSPTLHRYYHVFREGELDQLIHKYINNLHIISSYYDHASWCIVAEKVQVWTI